MAVGLTIGTIREALATQVGNYVANDITVDAWPTLTMSSGPRITVDYQSGNPVEYWGTFGSSGISTVHLELVCEPGGEGVTVSQRLDQYLSAGTGNTWSVVDAVMEDHTLGLGAAIDVTLTDVTIDDSLVAHFMVTVTISKQGANA
jgi:hypothetical protein